MQQSRKEEEFLRWSGSHFNSLLHLQIEYWLTLDGLVIIVHNIPKRQAAWWRMIPIHREAQGVCVPGQWLHFSCEGNLIGTTIRQKMSSFKDTSPPRNAVCQQRGRSKLKRVKLCGLRTSYPSRTHICWQIWLKHHRFLIGFNVFIIGGK